MQKLTKKAALPNVVQMPLVNAYAAGIDIGDTIHAVAIPGGLDDKRVQTFGTMTCDLEAIAEWLIKTGITNGGHGKYRCLLEAFVQPAE